MGWLNSIWTWFLSLPWWGKAIAILVILGALEAIWEKIWEKIKEWLNIPPPTPTEQSGSSKFGLEYKEYFYGNRKFFTINSRRTCGSCDYHSCGNCSKKYINIPIDRMYTTTCSSYMSREPQCFLCAWGAQDDDASNDYYCVKKDKIVHASDSCRHFIGK